MPKEEYLKELYVNSEAQKSSSAQSKVYVNLSESDMSDRVRSLTKPKVDFISSFVLEEFQNLKWVDVGSGTGDTLLIASELGFRVRGIESDSNQVEVARARGVETNEIFLDETNSKNELKDASLVSFLNVVEHLTDPLNFIITISSALAAGTLLAIEVPRHPSITSIIQTFSESDTYRHAVPPEHLNIFSDQSMKILMEKSGMDILGRWLFGSDALQMVSTIFDKFSSSPGLRNSLQENEYNLLQQAIDLYELSDTMLIIARKR
jgi:SAM-dependent methyltransferase